MKALLVSISHVINYLIKAIDPSPQSHHNHHRPVHRVLSMHVAAARHEMLHYSSYPCHPREESPKLNIMAPTLLPSRTLNIGTQSQRCEQVLDCSLHAPTAPSKGSNVAIKVKEPHVVELA